MAAVMVTAMATVSDSNGNGNDDSGRNGDGNGNSDGDSGGDGSSGGGGWWAVVVAEGREEVHLGTVYPHQFDVVQTKRKGRHQRPID